MNFFSQSNGGTTPATNIPISDEPIPENPGVTNQVPVLTPEEQQEVELENGKKLMNSAIITSNPILCEQISIPELKQACIDQSSLSLALSESDPLVCNGLSEVGSRECRDQVYYQIAQQSGKIEDCTKITGKEIGEKCTQEIELKAIKKQVDTGANGTSKLDCDSYTNEIAKQQCIVDKRLFDDQSQLKDAIENQSSASCETISDQTLKQDCYDAVYFSRAKTSKKVEICDNIVNSETKEHCRTTLSDFSDSSLFEDAMIEQSTKLCEKISQSGMRTSCIDRIRINEIIKSGNREDCSTLTDVSLRSSCENSF